MLNNGVTIIGYPLGAAVSDPLICPVAVFPINGVSAGAQISLGAMLTAGVTPDPSGTGYIIYNPVDLSVPAIDNAPTGLDAVQVPGTQHVYGQTVFSVPATFDRATGIYEEKRGCECVAAFATATVVSGIGLVQLAQLQCSNDYKAATLTFTVTDMTAGDILVIELRSITGAMAYTILTSHQWGEDGTYTLRINPDAPAYHGLSAQDVLPRILEINAFRVAAGDLTVDCTIQYFNG